MSRSMSQCFFKGKQQKKINDGRCSLSRPPLATLFCQDWCCGALPCEKMRFVWFRKSGGNQPLIGGAFFQGLGLQIQSYQLDGKRALRDDLLLIWATEGSHPRPLERQSSRRRPAWADLCSFQILFAFSNKIAQIRPPTSITQGG